VTAIISLLVVLVLSLAVTRVAAVALRLTGMAQDAARFQARSAFTGCGFTTTEAEQIVQHPARRRIAGWLMMAGTLQFAAVTGTAILSLVGVTEGAIVTKLATLGVGLLAVYLLASSSIVDHLMCGATSWLLRRYTSLETRDFKSLLHLGGEYAIAEIQVGHDHELTGRSVASAVPHSCGLVVLGVSRDDGSFIGLPAGETVIRPHDTVVVYGKPTEVSALDAGGITVAGEITDA